MPSNCAAEKGHFQFFFFFGQRRRKILFRRDPRLEPVGNAEDELICAEGLDDASTDARLENTRSRLGWGITHI